MFRGFTKTTRASDRPHQPEAKRPKTTHTSSSSSTTSTTSASSISTTGSNDSGVGSPTIVLSRKSSNASLGTPRRASLAASGMVGKGEEMEDEEEEEEEVPVEEKDTAIDAAFPSFSEEEYNAAFRPRSISIYVKAFMFALETVLKFESHLFDEAELECFARFRSLPYEAQYLYVRLFLRKTNAWFRIDKLKYYSDIANLPRACASLWDKEVRLADSQDSFSSLSEAASLLSLDELKTLAKEAKVTGPTKSALLSSLSKASANQAALKNHGQLKLEFSSTGTTQNRDAYFLAKAIEILGPCIRLTQGPSDLFNRLHLIFYRSTEYTEKSLRTVVLARMSKKNFPDYFVSRTANIFPTRAALLEFEKAIKLQAEVDEILQNSGVPTKEGLEKVQEIFEGIYPRWEELVAEEARKTGETRSEDGLMERVYLRRFNAGWVYTRIVHKGVYVLGRHKLYAREHKVLTALLAQPFFHTARRGGWYQRRALIEENYMSSLPHPSLPPNLETTKKAWKRRALETCISGLRDPATHIIYHHDLQKRIQKLEKKLKVPHRLQHDFGHAQLVPATRRIIYGVKLSETSLGRKTIWRDPADPKAKVSVEEMCLSTYRQEGWKGYHCEGRLLTTLFAYLFYDILFCYCPNVFETEYQTAPLDLFTDAFYPARVSEINHRLAEISNGAAARLVAEVNEAQRGKHTCVVGLDWSFSREDLLEIVQCIGGMVLSTVCKVFCEEYAQRTGGLPDLFLWRMEGPEGPEARFVEVKSENDRLSETQRLWLHVLGTAGAKVELCSALEEGKREKVEEREKKENEKGGKAKK